MTNLEKSTLRRKLSTGTRKDEKGFYYVSMFCGYFKKNYVSVETINQVSLLK